MGRAMRIIRRSHQHIKNETLSEYLDGRIQGSALASVEQQLTDCQECRTEMESLRLTLTMLRELPEEAPRNSFVMAAPPLMPAREPSSAFHLPNFGLLNYLRVPQWAYAGAASVAVIVFVALISADATGLLSTDDDSQFQVVYTTVTREDESVAAAPQAAQEDPAPQAAQAAAPAAPPEDSAPPQTTAPAATAALAAPEQRLAAAPAQESVGQDSSETATSEDAAAPIAMAAEAPLDRTAAAAATVEPGLAPNPEQAAGAAGPRAESGSVSDDGLAETETPPIAPPEVEKVPATAPAPTGVLPPESEGTALVWRVLEGIAAALGLLFLVALGLKWRLTRNARAD